MIRNLKAYMDDERAMRTTVSRYLFATTKEPIGNTRFFTTLRLAGEQYGVTVIAVKGCPGPRGCYNLAVKVESPSRDLNETFGKMLNQALFPSQWCDYEDDFEGFVLDH